MLRATKSLTFSPRKGGVSKYFSPHVILTWRALEYEKHFRYLFGAYVQVNNDPDFSGSNEPRSLDCCIYLRPSPYSKQGGHELMDLTTGACIALCYVPLAICYSPS